MRLQIPQEVRKFTLVDLMLDFRWKLSRLKQEVCQRHFTRYSCILASFFLCGVAFAQEQQLQQVTLPSEVVRELVVPTTVPNIEGLVWNRWTSENFVVCSLNDEQGRYLTDNLEHVKTWVYDRWGFENLKFRTECRLICVSNTELFKEFFGLDESKVSIRYDESGKPELIVIFLLLNDKPSKTIPIPITEACLANLDVVYNFRTPLWAAKSFAHLNATIPSIQEKFRTVDSSIKQNRPLYGSKGVLEVKDFDALSPEDKKEYIAASVVFTMMLRKEFGEDRLHNFYKHCADGNSPEEGLRSIYRFDSYADCDSHMKEYVLEVVSKLDNKQIGDAYFQVN